MEGFSKYYGIIKYEVDFIKQVNGFVLMKIFNFKGKEKFK